MSGNGTDGEWKWNSFAYCLFSPDNNQNLIPEDQFNTPSASVLKSCLMTRALRCKALFVNEYLRNRLPEYCARAEADVAFDSTLSRDHADSGESAPETFVPVNI